MLTLFEDLKGPKTLIDELRGGGNELRNYYRKKIFVWSEFSWGEMSRGCKFWTQPYLPGLLWRGKLFKKFWSERETVVKFMLLRGKRRHTEVYAPRGEISVCVGN